MTPKPVSIAPRKSRTDKGISRLSERDLKLKAFFLDGHTLKESGASFGITAERVRQVLNRMGIETNVRIWKQTRTLALLTTSEHLPADSVQGCEGTERT